MGAASRCLALALLCTSFLLASAAASSEMLMMTNRFHAWRAAHNRTYATAAERQRRFEVYRRNVEYIEATNRRGGLSYQLGETSSPTSRATSSWPRTPCRPAWCSLPATTRPWGGNSTPPRHATRAVAVGS